MGRMIPCGFAVSRETGEILAVERCEMTDEDFMKIAAAVWGLKIERRKGHDVEDDQKEPAGGLQQVV